MADKKKISKKTLAKAFHHWYYGHLTCFSQEHMQTFRVFDFYASNRRRNV